MHVARCSAARFSFTSGPSREFPVCALFCQLFHPPDVNVQGSNDADVNVSDDDVGISASHEALALVTFHRPASGRGVATATTPRSLRAIIISKGAKILFDVSSLRCVCTYM